MAAMGRRASLPAAQAEERRVPTVCVQGPKSESTAAPPAADARRRYSAPCIDSAEMTRLLQLPGAEARGRRKSLTPSTSAGTSRQASMGKTPSMGRTPSVGRSPARSREPSVGRAPSTGRPGSAGGSISVTRLNAKRRARRAEEEEAAPAEPSPRFVRLAEARMIARKLGLQQDEVKAILESFDRVAGKHGGFLNLGGFRRAVAILELSEQGVESAWQASTGEAAVPGAWVDEFCIDKFLAWYASEQRWASLSESVWTASVEELDRLADLHCVSRQVLDLVARSFYRLDAKGCGSLDFEQLKDGMRRNIRFNRLGEGQLLRIWEEIKQGAAGSVDFAEFTQWYLKYFDWDSRDILVPMDSFYALLSGPDREAWADI